MRDNAIGNFDETAEFVFDRARDRGPLGTILAEAPRIPAVAHGGFLDAHAGLLERRVREGRIRRRHADLHAGNVCLAPEGIVIYDCIEFRAAFRCGDVACDLAFLLMDLDMRDFRAFGAFLARRYAEASRDEGLAGLLPFYKGYRACVRGKVASLRARGIGAAEAKLEAMRYFQLAAAYELPHALVLTCGLPASGKSFVARAIARPFEAVVLQSDAVRKRLPAWRSGARHQAGYRGHLHAGAHGAHLRQAPRGRAAAPDRGGP
ncbi:MAG: AAA family ATPase [Acidobacteriota bacterium]